MPKINFINSKGLLVKYIIKIIVTTVFSLSILSSLLSYIIYKTDLDIDILQYISVIVCGFSAVFISYFSVSSFKNNGALMGIISCCPLIVFSIINLIINKSSLLVFFIKIIIILLLSAYFGNISIKNKKKIRVK